MLRGCGWASAGRARTGFAASMPPRPRVPVPFQRPFTYRDLAPAGITRATFRGWRERGDIVELNPGVFVAADLADERLAAIWSDRRVSVGAAVVSIKGAAVAYGLPVAPNLHPSCTTRRSANQYPAEEIVLREGVLLPSLEWTALKLGSHQSLAGALVAIDAALAAGADRERMAALAAEWRRHPGSRHLARAVAYADARSGSALESWSRGLMIDADLPEPELQARFEVNGVIMYPDFLWRELRLIGEADGLEKYGDAFGQRDAIAAEKRRQSRLQAMGFVLLRWGWRDVYPDERTWLASLRRQLVARAS